MRNERVAQLQARHLHRFIPVGNVHHNQAMGYRHALDEIVPDDGGNSAERAGKVIDKFGCWLVFVDVADALDAAAESLNVDPPIGANTRLLRGDMPIVIVADIQIGRLEQFQIRECDRKKDVTPLKTLSKCMEEFVDTTRSISGRTARL